MPCKPLISLMSNNRDMLRVIVDVTRCFCRDTICRRSRGPRLAADTLAGARGDAPLEYSTHQLTLRRVFHS
jgi:hypothetical protein